MKKILLMGLLAFFVDESCDAASNALVQMHKNCPKKLQAVAVKPAAGNCVAPPKDGAKFSRELFLKNSDRIDVADKFNGTVFKKDKSSKQGMFRNKSGETLRSNGHGWTYCHGGVSKIIPLLSAAKADQSLKAKTEQKLKVEAERLLKVGDAPVKKELKALEKKKGVILGKEFKDWIAFLCGAKVHNFPGAFTSLAAFRGADDKKLEEIHNYVQLVFPNTGKSKSANPDYYLNNKELVVKKAKGTTDPLQALSAILNNKQSSIGSYIRSNAKLDLLRMLRFWGFAADVNYNDKLSISQKNKGIIMKNLTGSNHNQLRVTRVLLFLKILGMRDYATAIKAQLAKINPGTYGKYWKNA